MDLPGSLTEESPKAELLSVMDTDDFIAGTVLSLLNNRFSSLRTDRGVLAELDNVPMFKNPGAVVDLDRGRFNIIVDMLGMPTLQLARLIDFDTEHVRIILHRLNDLDMVKHSYSKRGLRWMPMWAYDKILLGITGTA